MSAILEEGIGFGGKDSTQEGINYDNLPVTTDVIISHYEDKLNRRIADKTVKASKGGVHASFTQEEWLYLNKKSLQENAEAEITVTSPTIIIKKGNTEINIKNAAGLVKRMAEKYPNGMSEDSREDFYRQPFIEASIEEGLKNEYNPIMKENFKAMVNFDVKKVSPDMAKAVASDVETFQKSQFSSNNVSDIKSINKNAYEIRNEVLSMAFEFLKWQTELGIVNITTGTKSKLSYTNIPRVDDVLDIAKKFYSFVENRR